MGDIIGFLLDCFFFSLEGKGDGNKRMSRGCLFVLIAAFALMMLIAVLVLWPLLRPGP